MDECSSNPCQNNATCVDDVNGYICECHQGFRGKKVCFVGVATMLVEPRPYKCVGSGKSLLMSTNTCICECHQIFRGKENYGFVWATPHKCEGSRKKLLTSMSSTDLYERGSHQLSNTLINV